MPYYTVNATMTLCAWKQVEADSPEEAVTEAQEYSASDWDYDMGTAELELNVDPMVEEDAA